MPRPVTAELLTADFGMTFFFFLASNSLFLWG